MHNNFLKLTECIRASKISDTDKVDLVFIFSLTKKDEDLGTIVKLFSEDPSWIEKINDNYKGKSAALAARSTVAWDKIIEDEERQLRQFEI